MTSDPTRTPVIDGHMHVWDPSRSRYAWLTPASDPSLRVLDRVFDLAEVSRSLTEHGIDAVVLIQSADTVEDTLIMFDQAARSGDRVAGVVAWVPLDRPDAAAALLDAWSAQPVVGVRHLIHREPDESWLLRPDVDEGLALLSERGLAFDVCAESVALLSLVPAIAERHPDLRLVIDHLAKPPVASRWQDRPGAGAAGSGQVWRPWARALAAAAEAPSVYVKLSGLTTSAPPGASAEALQPYVDLALEAFGAERTLIGSDWPFAQLSVESFEQAWSPTVETVTHLDPTDRARVLGGTARAVYRLGEVTLPPPEPSG